VFLVEARYNDKVVGLGFFVENTRKVFGCLPIKQWYLHKTGNPIHDQIWIEHNDFLLDQSMDKIVRIKMLEYVINSSPFVKEFVFGLSKKDILEDISSCFNEGFFSRYLIETVGYSLDFTKFTSNYLSEVLSKNTRSQIKRSKRLLENKGALSFKIVKDKDEIFALFDHMSKIHINLWHKSSNGSGFSNSSFIKFYQQLVKMNTCNESLVEVSVLSINGVGIGYLVNYIYKNKVYFYLSALTKSEDNRIKIGLLLHSEAIQFYHLNGYESYDFLGGDARYKKSLSDSVYNMNIVSFNRNNPLLRLENFLRNHNPFKV
jgi:hypothetical protein